MKTKRKLANYSAPATDPIEQDPFFGHSEWVEPEMKRAAAQEERRSSRHSGKTIRRPAHVTRTMAT